MEIEKLAVVRALRPLRQPYIERLSEHSDLAVWHLDVEFEEFVPTQELADRWTTKAVNVAETWQKRPLVAGVGELAYGCGEIEIVRRLRSAGFEAWWISEWSGFPHVAAWEPYCIKRSEFRSRAPDLWQRDQRLRAEAHVPELGMSGGHPDIACSTPEGPVYFEYKGPNDSVKPKQNRWAAALIQTEPNRAAYFAVRGAFRRQHTAAAAAAKAAPTLPARVSAVPDRFQEPAAAPLTEAARPKRGKDRLHRRTISDTLKRERKWLVTSKVDGSVDVTPPRGRDVDNFAEEVREAVKQMGYDPTVRIARSAGKLVVRVHTPETLAQTGRGAHER